MQLTSLLPIFSFTAFALAAPSLLPRTNGYMALENMSRTCNDDKKTCHYHFTIDEAPTTTGPGPALFVCDFDVTARTAAPYNEVNARYTDFSGALCSNGFGSRFQINGGWSGDHSFITIVPSDYLLDYWAFFGLTAAAPDNLGTDGNVALSHTSPARQIGIFP